MRKGKLGARLFWEFRGLANAEERERNASSSALPLGIKNLVWCGRWAEWQGYNDTKRTNERANERLLGYYYFNTRGWRIRHG